MDAHVGEVVPGDGVDRRHDRRLVAGGRVHADECHAVLGEPGERFAHALVVDPVAVAQLDRELARGDRLDERARAPASPLRLGAKAGVSWSSSPPSLPAFLERLDGVQDLAREGGLEVGGQLHPPAGGGPYAVAQVGRQRVEAGGVAGEQAVELDVEGEVSGVTGTSVRPSRAPAPHRSSSSARRTRSAAAYQGSRSLRRHARRIPVLDEAGIGPARGADEDAAAAHVPLTVRSRDTLS